MPWYYASPEAKPAGPVSVQELQALRLNGTISPETYVIEHTAQPPENWSWKRYKDVFPSNPALPPMQLPVFPPGAPPPVPPVPQPAQVHPLFPSAAASIQPSVFPGGPSPDPYYKVRPTNGWCGWGLFLGVVGFVFSFVCGMGLLLAVPSFILCIVGLAQVHRHPGQSGQGLAIAGLVLSGFALVISLIVIVWFAMNFQARELTVTEQTSNDSESCGQLGF